VAGINAAAVAGVRDSLALLAFVRISVKPDFRLEVSVPVPFLVDLVALLQQLNHGHAAAGGIDFVLALEFGLDLEVKRLRVERRRLFQILRGFFEWRGRFAVLFGWRNLGCNRLCCLFFV